MKIYLINKKLSNISLVVATAISVSLLTISCKSNKNAETVRNAFAENDRNNEKRYREDEAKMSKIITVMNKVTAEVDNLENNKPASSRDESVKIIKSNLDQLTALLNSMNKSTKLNKNLIQKFNDRRKIFLDSLNRAASKYEPISEIAEEWQRSLN